ncbi:hypothetical protein EV424DRAFT_1446006 [Suillus variegatus]|nr:hypothetical protein EV424DRAFT_1446006 [Suillus variegatus]
MSRQWVIFLLSLGIMIDNPATRQSLPWRRSSRCPNDAGIMRMSSASQTLAWNPTAHMIAPTLGLIILMQRLYQTKLQRSS